MVLLIAIFSNFQFNSQHNKVYGDDSRIAVGQVTATTLNIRSEPNTNARRIAQVSRGTKLSIYEKGINKDWLKVKINNQWGFVHGSFVTIIETFTPNQNSLTKVADGRVTATTLNIRSEPTTTSQRIGVLTSGTKIDIFETGINKDWLKIRVNNRWGYIHRNFVTVTENRKTPTPKPTQSNEVISRGKVNVTTLNVRSEANANARRVTTLSAGTEMDIYETGVNKDWLRIRINNNWAYVHGNFVTLTNSTQKPKPAPTPPSNQVIGKAQVTVTTLNVRTEPNTSARRITTLSQGTNVDIYETGVNKDWLKIKVNNDWGYIHSNFVTVTQANSTPPTVEIVARGEVTATTLNIRSEPNQSSNRIGTLSRKEQVDIYEIGINKDWLKIKVGNQWGYIHGNHVRMIGNQPTIDTSMLRNKVIVIDPGHGGRDPGAVAFGLMEKDIVLATALRLEAMLQQAGAKVVMTRKTDQFLALGDRTKVVNQEKADLFLSLHVNSSSLATVHGTETFWNRNYERFNSQALATSLQSTLVNTLGTRDRGVKEAGFEIIKYTKVPSVLIELGFITNYNEAQRLASEEFQDQASQAIIEGLVNYYNQ